MDERRRKVIVALAITAADRFMKLLEEDSDSESENEKTLAMLMAQGRCRRRGILLKPARNEDYYDVAVPRYNARQFREHFRLTRSTFESLEFRLGPKLQGNEEEAGRPRIDVRSCSQSCGSLPLRTLFGDRFDMGKSILHDSFKRVVHCLVAEANNFIAWPRGQKLEETKIGFFKIGLLPNIIGAVDGSYIPIPKPKVDHHFYNTRKHFYAIILQAICDSNLLFTDCFAGYPGSVSDIRVFRNSDIWLEVHENIHHYFPGEEYIIGDKAYPVLTWCIPPYINRGILTQNQKIFNTALSSVRQVIERAFALLKGRFRRLKYLEMQRIDLIPDTIMACCVLHNICLLGCDENNDDFIREGAEECERGVRDNVEPNQDIPHDPAGTVKRDHLVNIVIREHRRINAQNRN